MKTETPEKLVSFEKNFLLLLVITLFFIFVGVALLAWFYSEPMYAFSEWIYLNLGFPFLCLLVFVSDTFISPIPPDAALFVIATSQLAENWVKYVLIISLCSMISGFCGWGIGYYLSKRKWVPEALLSFAKRKEKWVRKYGVWAVVVGALTPFPFSMTCWAAGFLHLKLSVFTLGVLARVPRVFVYYWVIEFAQSVPERF